MSEHKDQFKKLLDVLTVLFVGGGLLVASYQGYEIRKSIDAANQNTNFSTWNSIAQEWLDMDSMFVEHPDLRKYVFEGAPIPTDPAGLERATAAANKVLDFMDNAVTIENYVKATKDQSSGLQNILQQSSWDNYFGSIFSNSPIICAMILKFPGGYDPNTVDLAHSNCPKNQDNK